MTFLLGDMAVESKRPLGVNASLCSLTQVAKDSLSESGSLLQSACLEINENEGKSWKTVPFRQSKVTILF